jgi:hypothetical protein
MFLKWQAYFTSAVADISLTKKVHFVSSTALLQQPREISMHRWKSQFPSWMEGNLEDFPFYARMKLRLTIHAWK